MEVTSALQAVQAVQAAIYILFLAPSTDYQVTKIHGLKFRYTVFASNFLTSSFVYKV